MTVFILVALPSYRERWLDEMSRHFGKNVLIYVGQEAVDSTVKTRVRDSDRVIPIRTIFLFRRRLLWQCVEWRQALKASVVVLQLNPRLLSTWLVLIMRRALGRRTILWGHAFARKGPNARTRWLRDRMRALGNDLVVYTSSEAARLGGVMRGGRVFVAPNALYFRREMRPVTCGHRDGFIFVGRLVPEKKPELLARGYIAARSMLPEDCLLHIVGAGPLRTGLEELARSGGCADDVCFYGEVTDYEEIRSLYARSLASVSPGCVGLSLTQSLGFGVPMIVARDELHGPEIEAAKPEFNSIFCASDNVAELANALVSVSENRSSWLARARAISVECAERYSIEGMVCGFLSAIEGKRC